MKSLKGKVALITGVSRSTGIGTAVSYGLAEAGVDIFFTHYSPYDETEGNGKEDEWPETLTAHLEEMGVRVGQMEADLADESLPSELLDTVEKQLGVPTILVHNATYGIPTNFRNLTGEALDKHYGINNKGPIMLSLEFAKRFENTFPPAHGGRIIQLVSGGPDPENLAYIATKGTLKALTPPLATGLAPLGITVNSVDPGPTDSGWMDDETKESLLPLFPKGRLGTPSDAAKIIKFLASPESDWVTGQVIYSDGGFLGR